MKIKSGIYKISNLITLDIYIGSAICLINRKSNHFNILKNNKHYNKKLQNSVNKHGIENFIFEIIELVEDKNKLIEREQYYLDTLNPNYNIRKIADSNLGIKYSEESIKKGIETKMKNGTLNNSTAESIRKGIETKKANGNDHPTETTKIKMSLSASGRRKSEEAKLNMKKSIFERGGYRGSKNPHFNKGRPVVQLDLLGNFINRFDSIFKASKEMKCGLSNILSACINLQKTACGFQWVYEEDYNTSLNKKIYIPRDYTKSNRSTSVVQINNITGELIKVFSSIIEANLEIYGYSYGSAIVNVCKNKPLNKTAGGFKWMYKLDYEKQNLIPSELIN